MDDVMSRELQVIKRLAAALGVLCLILVSLGSFVRATGAGLACPDWPLCFGQMIPEMHTGVLQEYAHRVLAGIVTLLTVYLAVKSYEVRRTYPRLWILARFIVALLVVQVVMGGLTVLLQLRALIITLHLALGTVLLQAFAMLATDKGVEASEPSPLRKAAQIFVLLTFAQIVIGGFVGSTAASLACPDFPLCYGSLAPKAGPQHLQMFHRGMGLLMLCYGIFLVVKTRALAGRSRKLALIILGHIAAQIFVGALNVWMRIPVSVTVLHLVLAQAILFLGLSLVRELRPNSSFFLRARADGQSDPSVDKLGELPA